MQLIDTHVHLNFEVFQADFEAVRERWCRAGVVRLVHSCVSPSEFQSIQAIADRCPELAFAVGLHPLEVEEQWTSVSPQEIRALAQSEPRVVAIGETGLDFYKADNREQQQVAFVNQLSVARQLNLPVIVHCREAAASTAELLREFWRRQGALKGVMHCWGGTPEETQWFLDLGFYVSFSGTVTFKKATQIQESARMVPSHRLLIETDCPFLAPTPRRGKRNEPAFVRYVAEQVAALRGVSVETLATQTTRNACRLFGLNLSEVADSQSLSLADAPCYS